MKLKQLAQSLALIGLGASAATPALAQQTQQPVQKVERVEVTGSSIKRIASEGALPLQVITRSDMEKAGIVTAEQLIADLNVNGNGLDNLASNADVVAGAARGNNGASSANLRGQGASSTLVLLNGRRVASHGLNGGAVDLNSIPFAAVERVEVLKDGASATYGTDAIGGVINFILKRDFQGLQASTLYDATAAGGGNIARHQIVAGFGNLETNRFNILATLSRSDNKKLRGDQRDFVNTFQPNRGLSVDTRGTPFATVFPISIRPPAGSPAGTAHTGTILNRPNASSSTSAAAVGPTQPGTTLPMSGGINVLDLPGQAGCSSMPGAAAYDETLWQTPNAKWACAWDTGRAAVLQQPLTNTNAVLRGTLALGEHQLIAEYVRGRSESAKAFSPYQISSSGTPSSETYNVVYPSTGASYNYVFNEIAKVFPTIAGNYGNPIAFRWRCMDCGNRELTTTSDTGRWLLAAEGPLWGGWDYKAGYSEAFSESKSQAGKGYYYTTDLMNLIKSGTLNPFLKPGEAQTQAAIDGLAAASAEGVVLYGGRFELRQADVSATGPLFKLPAGEVMGAVGADVREETFIFSGDSRTQPRGVYLLPFDQANVLGNEVKRDIKAVYAEVLVPITKKLELTAAIRRDDYSGFGDTTNPKVSLRYAPLKSLMFRGSYNTGFRVPTFNQLFNGVTDATYAGKDLVDPAKCASGVVSTTPGCEAVTPHILTGGKIDLGPEEAKQYTVGMVWQPNDNLIFNLDYWNINREGTIQSLTLTQLVNNYALFPERFYRDSSGVLQYIDQRWINAGESVTRGLEFGARANYTVEGVRVSAGMDISYLLEKKSRLITSQPFGPSEIGRFTRAGDLGIRWKHSAFLTLAKGNWSGTLTQIYRDAYYDAVLPGVASGAIRPADWNAKVDPYLVHHISTTYKGIKNLSLTVGIKNLFDKDPPFSAAYDSNTGAGSSWEPRVADPRGRSYMVSASYTFF